ncbi:response regulator transcription factor [Paenibacillus segetis]|uniref:Two-component system, response regulator YesN n=1 Tax=Paenibacillus segetis TaxID=1325360 RepID=A0ABQ1YW85_9BACL|nr:response regulator [Paenibacillus segetis]GGH38375.1 hypothetical protein GCM10008013_46400 [Paenibacillus segetis]
MLRVIIADDERLIRLTLRSMIEDSSFNIQIVAEAKDGTELLQYIEEHHPDLVFVDIRMPGLSGLEAMEQGKGLSPHTQWVVLTGFSDFNYARHALRLQAFDYLLKPVSPEELEATLSKVLLALETKVNQLSNHFETAVNSLFHRTRSIEEIGTKYHLQDYHFLITLFDIDSYLPEQEQTKLRFEWIHKLKEAYRTQVQFAMLENAISFVTLPNGDLAQVIGWRKSAEKRAKLQIPHIQQILTQEIQQFQTDSCIVTGFQCDHEMDLFDLEEGIIKLAEFLPLRRLLPSGRLWMENEAASFAARPNYVVISEQVDKLSKLAHLQDYFQYANELTQLVPMIQTLNQHDPYAIRNLREFLCITLGCELDASQQVDQWITSLQRVQESRLAEKSQTELSQSDLIQRVVNYVNTNYMNDIGIGQIAHDIDVTPNYLSSLFHKKTGQKFMKYLTHIRMMKAKELFLTKPGLKVQQVAEQVGYYSTRHFTKLFQEQFDCYPSEIHQKMNPKQS